MTGNHMMKMTEGQRAYEARRAAKVGMSLERWLEAKETQHRAEETARLRTAKAATPPKPPGFWSRLLDKAHKPL